MLGDVTTLSAAARIGGLVTVLLLTSCAPEGTPREEWAARAGGAEAVVNAVAVELGGSFSAEHGIGQSKRHAMATHKDPVALDVMRAVKAAIDPRGLMNPGKVLP